MAMCIMAWARMALGKERRLGKADIIDRLVPGHNQRRIDQPQMSQCAIFLPPLVILWRSAAKADQGSRQCQSKNFM